MPAADVPVDHNRGMADDSDPDRAPGVLPSAEFPTVVGRESYRCDEVDGFVAALTDALQHDPPAMAPYEVDDARFHPVRWRRGYDMAAVDDYLDAARALLSDRHGGDVVSGLQGRPAQPHHVSTIWIYAVAGVIVAAVIAYLLITL